MVTKMQNMNWQNALRILKSDYLMLLFIMALAFYLAFIPHQNYSYPVHIDEWMHLTHSKAILQAGDTTLIEPFTASRTIGPSSNLAVGFHLFWGVFHQISGISWLTIFKYFPGIVFMITVLSVYALARREGFGWEAALLTCMIPTTVGILGPGFLVPVAMGLLFIPLSLFLAFNFKTVWSYLVLFIFTCFLLSMHAITAVGMVIALMPYILLNLKGNFKHSLGITLALAIPFLAPFPWIFNMLLPTAKALFSPEPLAFYVDIPLIINTYGYLPILFCLLGTLLLVVRGGKRSYGLVLGLLAFLLILVAYFTFHYGVHHMYYRGLMYMMLMMSVVAGAGLMGVKNFRLPVKLTARLRTPIITRNVGKILCLVLIGLTLATCIPDRHDIVYYHVIDEQDYEAFVWIRDNVNESYEKAILDPWKAAPFAATASGIIKYLWTNVNTFPKNSPAGRANLFHRWSNHGLGGPHDFPYKGITLSLAYQY